MYKQVRCFKELRRQNAASWCFYKALGSVATHCMYADGGGCTDGWSDRYGHRDSCQCRYEVGRWVGRGRSTSAHSASCGRRLHGLGGRTVTGHTPPVRSVRSSLPHTTRYELEAIIFKVKATRSQSFSRLRPRPWFFVLDVEDSSQVLILRHISTTACECRFMWC